ncbi:olfactory receptor 14I1-like [Mergus octosetaceus]
MSNSSSITELVLLAFADTHELQLLHFVLLLGIYLAALLGNGLILSAVACHHRLHTPMYFFLLNLALLDLGCISTTLPKAMPSLDLVVTLLYSVLPPALNPLIYSMRNKELKEALRILLFTPVKT